MAEDAGELSYDDFVRIHSQPGGEIRLNYVLASDDVSSDSDSSEAVAGHVPGPISDSSSDDEAEDEANAEVGGEEAHAVKSAMEIFETFDELKKYAESIMKCKLSNNKRTSRNPPKWVKTINPDATSHWFNGTLYCMQALKSEHDKFVTWAKTSCTCFARYAMCSGSKKWQLKAHSCVHNHELEVVVQEGESGMIHISDASQLEEEQVSTIGCWLDAMQSTKQIRFHFRAKYQGKDVKRRVVRSLRTLRRKQKNEIDEGMDQLIDFLHKFEAAGGVGKLQYNNLKVVGIQVQHPLIREIAKMFGVVTTIDGTHNTTKHEESTLLCATGMDSFGKLFHSGLAFSPSENEQSMLQLIESLGLCVQTLITDASKAALALAKKMAWGHILCSYHFRKLFSQSMENIDAAHRKTIWESVMKTLRWNGYKSDADLFEVRQFSINFY
jgi:hypothetical protein